MRIHNLGGKSAICRAGFTITELLVAVSVVGVLATVLFAAVTKAKKQAHKAVCMNNLRQLGVAFYSYSTDHGKTLPYSKKGGNSGWVGLLKSYGITDQVLHCPMCNENNRHSMGGMRKDWRVGTSHSEGNSEPTDPSPQAQQFTQRQWARHPNYWRFVTGNFGSDCRAVFTLNHCAPGCSEHSGAHNPHPRPQPYCDPRTGVWITPPTPPLNLSPKCRGGSTVVLVMCENVKPSRFFMEMYDAESGRPLGERSGVTIDDPELYSWSGPLALALGGKGSLLAEGNLCHHEPVGFEQANALGKRSLQQGRFYPDPPNGRGRVNFIYMRTTIRSSVDHSLKIAVRGDEAYSVFVLKSDCDCSGGPGTPCDPGELATSSYGINTFVQSGHHHAKYEPGKFWEYQGPMGSSTPLFVEANWAWVMPSPYDLPPATLDGGFAGLQRALLNRHDKRVNVVYADGHVDSVRLPALYRQEWYPEFKLLPGVTPPQMPEN